MSSSEHIIETVMISSYEPKLSYCDLDLEDSNPFFAHGTLILGLVTKGSAIHKISSNLTLIETANLGCVIDLEHSNPIFSRDTFLLMMIYHQIEFGSKILIGLELIKDIVETIIF